MAKVKSRGRQIKLGRGSISNKNEFIQPAFWSRESHNLIPIIGDTIRLEQIFDLDDDDVFGGANYFDEDSFVIDYENMGVSEALSRMWAQEVQYPLADPHQLSRVAQFYQLEEGRNQVKHKERYLMFLKDKLLNIAIKAETDPEEQYFNILLYNDAERLTFSDIVVELDYPIFPSGKDDPLRTLAMLPIKIFVTTSYFNFLERELEAAGKQPISQLCFWNNRIDNLAPEHQRVMPNHQPTVEQPIVYHLFGMERYPKSMVFGEEDYLDFLWALARDKEADAHSGDSIIPSYLQTHINRSALMLLGYRLGDWDLRIVNRYLQESWRRFAGNSENRAGVNGREQTSTAIQLKVKDQPLVNDVTQAKKYLENYFQLAQLDVEFSDASEFIAKMGKAWRNAIQEGRVL